VFWVRSPGRCRQLHAMPPEEAGGEQEMNP
jgi:hypothetical protein